MKNEIDLKHEQLSSVDSSLAVANWLRHDGCLDEHRWSVDSVVSLFNLKIKI